MEKAARLLITNPFGSKNAPRVPATRSLTPYLKARGPYRRVTELHGLTQSVGVTRPRDGLKMTRPSSGDKVATRATRTDDLEQRTSNAQVPCDGM